MSTSRAIRARYPALALLALAAATPAVAQVDLTSIQATGEEKVNVSLRGRSRFVVKGPTAMTVDMADNASTVGFVVDIDGVVEDSGRRPMLEMIDWPQVELGLEAFIDANDPLLAPSDVAVDSAIAKVSLSARERGDLTVKLKLSVPFVVNAPNGVQGKLSLSSTFVEPRPPLCEGENYDGIESFTGSVRGVGSVRYKDEAATLVLSSESTPFDGAVDFTYTNPSASPNPVFTGQIDYSGRRPTFELSPGSVTALEQNLAQVILDEAGIVATVALGTAKSSFACGRDGDTAKFSYSAPFTAMTAQGDFLGKLTIGSKMVHP